MLTSLHLLLLAAGKAWVPTAFCITDKLGAL